MRLEKKRSARQGKTKNKKYQTVTKKKTVIIKFWKNHH